MSPVDFTAMSEQEAVDYIARLEDTYVSMPTAVLEQLANELEDQFANPYLYRSIKVLAESHATDLMDYICTKPDWRYLVDISEENFDMGVDRVLTILALENILLNREEDEEAQ